MIQSEEDGGQWVLSQPGTQYPSAHHGKVPPAPDPHKQLQQTSQNRAMYEVCSDCSRLLQLTVWMQFTSPHSHFCAQCASHHLTNKCYWPPKRLHCVLILHVVSRSNTAPLQPCINIYIAAVAALYIYCPPPPSPQPSAPLRWRRL